MIKGRKARLEFGKAVQSMRKVYSKDDTLPALLNEAPADGPSYGWVQLEPMLKNIIEARLG
jgi:hypothetical protein